MYRYRGYTFDIMDFDYFILFRSWCSKTTSYLVLSSLYFSPHGEIKAEHIRYLNESFSKLSASPSTAELMLRHKLQANKQHASCVLKIFWKQTYFWCSVAFHNDMKITKMEICILADWLCEAHYQYCFFCTSL